MMVRINIIEPSLLADQHLVAEYDEILMLLGYVHKYPILDLAKIPSSYRLGKGHILFFKNKLKYLKERHELIKNEMKKRGFETNITISLNKYPFELVNNWEASLNDKKLIKKRLIEKIKKKPNYYRYYGKYLPLSFFIKLIKKA